MICSLLIAQKVWDDKYLSNEDFAFIYPLLGLKELNEIEQTFLKMVHYQITVKADLYQKYYVELRALFKK